VGGPNCWPVQHGALFDTAKNAAAKAIFDIAELHHEAASDDMPPIAARGAAHHAARGAARAISPTLDASGLHAVQAAHQSTAIANTDNSVKLDAVTGHALRAHELVAVCWLAGSCF
jgi:hypothetical protein